MLTIETIKVQISDGIDTTVIVVERLLARRIEDKSHIRDLTAAIVARSHNLTQAVSLLEESGEVEAANAVVQAALDELKADDPIIFKPAPLRKEFSSLVARARFGSYFSRLPLNTQSFIQAEADRLDDVRRRRAAYQMLHDLKARREAGSAEAEVLETDPDQAGAAAVRELAGSGQ